MDSQQLKSIIDNDPCLYNKDVKILCRDQFLKLKLNTFQNIPLYFILNTEKCGSKKIGHWFCVVIANDVEPVDIFDSLALPNNYNYTFDKLHLVNDYYLTNIIPVQSVDSPLCGLFCTYYLKRKCLGMDLETIMYQFDLNNLHNNDKIVYLDSL